MEMFMKKLHICKVAKGIVLAIVLSLAASFFLPVSEVPAQAKTSTSTPKTSVSKKTIYKGNTYKIKFKGTTKGYTIKYSSSNKKVATVSKSGKITAKKVGKATITVTFTKKKVTVKSTIKVTVKKKKTTPAPVVPDTGDTEVPGSEPPTDTDGDGTADSTPEDIVPEEGDDVPPDNTEDDGLPADNDGDGIVDDDTTPDYDMTGCSLLGFDYVVKDVGIYPNWDGVTNVSLFTNQYGEAAFACDMEDMVAIFEKKNGTYSNTVNLLKTKPLFGGVTADLLGNYYVVSACLNEMNTPADCIYLTKYNSNGDVIATISDNGRSSLADYYPDDFATATPFRAGNCSIAYNGGIIAIHYAREMLSGHQSNSLWMVDAFAMSTLQVGPVYQSHSFAQRVVPTSNGFLLASEGDCYDRAFTVYDIQNLAVNHEAPIFHFAYQDGERENMSLLNNNYAHLGDIVALPNLKGALVARSARSLSEEAKREREDIFIQIFDTTRERIHDCKEAFITEGERTGVGLLSDVETTLTDHGVLWLTEGRDISSVHAVPTSDGRIVIIYDCYIDGNYKGIYYMVLSSDGVVLRQETLVSDIATMAPSETPLCVDDTVIWIGNTILSPELCEFSFKVE